MFYAWLLLRFGEAIQEQDKVGEETVCGSDGDHQVTQGRKAAILSDQELQKWM